MKLIELLQKEDRKFYFFVVMLGLVNSTLYSGILLFINYKITKTPLPVFPQYDWLVFVVLLLVSLASNKIFHGYMVKVTSDVLYHYEISTLRKIKYASFQAFEKLGSDRIYAAIGDTRILSQVPEMFMNAVNALIAIVCCIGYLFWVTPLGGGAVMLLMSVLLVFYLVRNKRLDKDINRFRDLQEEYYGHLRDLLHGFKEFKLSMTRNDTIYDKYLRENREKGRILTLRTSTQYVDNELFGSYSWYVLLGVVMFGLPHVFTMETQSTASVLVTILYMMGPASTLVSLLPFYNYATVALTRVEQLETDINQTVTERGDYGDLTEINRKFDSIRLEDVTYEYYDADKGKTFTLGPVNLTIRRGETLFITGGNGSGKSTFINLLTGLYKPTSGTLYLNGVGITSQNYHYYSNQISAVFMDNYLFKHNYNGFELSETNPELNDFLAMMQLNHVIRLNELHRQIDTKLSKGQQKRLALIYSLMERRQILVLDEWAAEQDPPFRAYFYETLLPKFKLMGKTVIAVTHDQHYFAHADRILHFDYGRIVQDQVADHQTELSRL